MQHGAHVTEERSAPAGGAVVVLLEHEHALAALGQLVGGRRARYTYAKVQY